jgi:hypothetical protein
MKMAKMKLREIAIDNLVRAMEDCVIDAQYNGCPSNVRLVMDLQLQRLKIQFVNEGILAPDEE